MSTKRGAANPQRRYWTDEEYGLIQSGEYPTRELALMMECSMSTIKQVRRRIESGDDGQGSRFNPFEDDVIRERGPHLTAKQLGALLGRPWQSVSDRRRKLGVPVGYNFDPAKIGARPLVAKTCLGCGLLLQADWFTFLPSKRKWSQRCRKCASTYTTQLPSYKASVARRMDKLSISGRRWIAEAQEYTRRHATHAGQPYTEADHKVLANGDLTHMDKAIQLGRTWVAIATACRTFGYKSHIGVGNPESDQWIIDNPNDPGRAAA